VMLDRGEGMYHNAPFPALLRSLTRHTAPPKRARETLRLRRADDEAWFRQRSKRSRLTGDVSATPPDSHESDRADDLGSRRALASRPLIVVGVLASLCLLCCLRFGPGSHLLKAEPDWPARVLSGQTWWFEPLDRGGQRATELRVTSKRWSRSASGSDEVLVFTMDPGVKSVAALGPSPIGTVEVPLGRWLTKNTLQELGRERLLVSGIDIECVVADGAQERVWVAVDDGRVAEPARLRVLRGGYRRGWAVVRIEGPLPKPSRPLEGIDWRAVLDSRSEPHGWRAAAARRVFDATNDPQVIVGFLSDRHAMVVEHAQRRLFELGCTDDRFLVHLAREAGGASPFARRICLDALRRRGGRPAGAQPTAKRTHGSPPAPNQPLPAASSALLKLLQLVVGGGHDALGLGRDAALTAVVGALLPVADAGARAALGALATTKGRLSYSARTLVRSQIDAKWPAAAREALSAEALALISDPKRRASDLSRALTDLRRIRPDPKPWIKTLVAIVADRSSPLDRVRAIEAAAALEVRDDRMLDALIRVARSRERRDTKLRLAAIEELARWGKDAQRAWVVCRAVNPRGHQGVTAATARLLGRIGARNKSIKTWLYQASMGNLGPEVAQAVREAKESLGLR
jgi:hypothetical protein